ncbi:MAG: PrsW family glutamic-type intramembrane protease, partial [Anaerolineae bacterium]
SAPLRLPRTWLMAGWFVLALLAGILAGANQVTAILFFVPALLVAAAMPPLLAIAWLQGNRQDGLTWRRGAVAFWGGATVSTLLAVVLEFALPLFVVALLLGRSDLLYYNFSGLLTALEGNEVSRALTNPAFVFAFIQLTIIAPLVEETVKPLVTLPLIGRLARRDAFLVAAMAGAGFAVLENVLYAGTGLSIWAGILLVRATGAAIHPVGAGLVGLSLRDLLNGERDAARNGLARFGLAVGLHALWNGGSLLVITLAGARFFGPQPAGLNVMGLSIAGIALAFLIVLGLGALWLGRTVLARLETPGLEATPALDVQFLFSNRAVALWAIACLIVVVPASVMALRGLLR